jgi:hypothetical protein
VPKRILATCKSDERLSRVFVRRFLLCRRSAARRWGWQSSSRTTWQKPDGTTVCFICLEEQLAAVPAGTRVHRIGHRRAA